MDNKEVEEKLEKSVHDIKKREFSEVWEEIEPEIKTKKKKLRFKMIIPVATVAFATLTVAIAIPTALKKDAEKIYFVNELGTISVQEEEFYKEIKNADIDCVDFSRYYVESYVLLKTRDLKVKGGLLDAADDEDDPTMIMTIKFFDSSVNVKGESYADYVLTYSVNGATIHYKMDKHLEEGEDETYEYLIKAEYRNVTYIIDFTSLSDNVTTFFDMFFD